MDHAQRHLAAAVAGRILSRRGLLADVCTGLAGIGLAHLLADDAAAAPVQGWQPGSGQTHHAAKAQRVLQIFCPGAASHIDLWDHKPELEQRDGKPLPGEENLVSFQGKNGNLMRSPWPFVPRAAERQADQQPPAAPGAARGRHRLRPLDDLARRTRTAPAACS